MKTKKSFFSNASFKWFVNSEILEFGKTFIWIFNYIEMDIFVNIEVIVSICFQLRLWFPIPIPIPIMDFNVCNIVDGDKTRLLVSVPPRSFNSFWKIVCILRRYE